MIILGIDPGIATIGFGIVEAHRSQCRVIQYGVLSTPAGLPLSHRLTMIYEDMQELIHTFHPDEMAVEELFFNTNLTTGISVAHGRGVILLAAEQLGVHPHASEIGGDRLRQSGQKAGHADDPAALASGQTPSSR